MTLTFELTFTHNTYTLYFSLVLGANKITLKIKSLIHPTSPTLLDKIYWGSVWIPNTGVRVRVTLAISGLDLGGAQGIR